MPPPFALERLRRHRLVQAQRFVAAGMRPDAYTLVFERNGARGIPTPSAMLQGAADLLERVVASERAAQKRGSWFGLVRVEGCFWRERVGGSPSVPATTLRAPNILAGTGFIALTATNINEITVRFSPIL
ncbi:MAG: hypothetical protein WAK88_15100, partial [Candidatus Cybelea sp.]